jgi:hypothetical protein
MSATNHSRALTSDPKVLAEKFNILAALVARQGGEVRIPLGQLGGGERLEFFFDVSSNEHVVRLGPVLDAVSVDYVPPSPAVPDLAWRATVPGAWRCIINRNESELLALRLGADLNIAGWLDTGEHFLLCADQGLRGREFELSGARFTVIETEMVTSGAPYRRLSKIIVRRHA